MEFLQFFFVKLVNASVQDDPFFPGKQRKINTKTALK